MKKIAKDEVELVYFSNGNMTIFNLRNGNFYTQTIKEKREISFRHSQNNKCNFFSTSGFTLRHNGKRYEVRQLGDSVNLEDGSIACYLKYQYMQELLHKVFYEPKQERVYDFIKEEPLIPF